MHRVMLLNPKGGSGKTTIATCLAGVYAASGLNTVIFDHDAQGSSTRWLNARPEGEPAIEGVAAFRNPAGVTRSWQMRVPPGTDRVVIDTPAGLKSLQLADLVRGADSIIVPVLPSPIDIDAVAGFVAQLNSISSVRQGSTKLAVVANRVRVNTRAFTDLERFLAGLEFPLLTRLRDSQNYIRAGEAGLGIHELRRVHTRVDRRQWAPMLQWLEDRIPRELTLKGDLLSALESHIPATA